MVTDYSICHSRENGNSHRSTQRPFHVIARSEATKQSQSPGGEIASLRSPSHMWTPAFAGVTARGALCHTMNLSVRDSDVEPARPGRSRNVRAWRSLLLFLLER